MSYFNKINYSWIGMTLLLALAGGCSADEGAAQKSAAPPDTSVHAAETAQGQVLDEVLEHGKAVYLANCAACHQPNGQGLPGAFPPLAGSDYLAGDRKDVLKVALFGLSGPITVNDKQYNNVMPSQGHLSDDELAAAISYVLSSWGNDFAAVSVEEVAALRTELGQQDRASGEPHTGTTASELRYEGAPLSMKADASSAVINSAGVSMTKEEFSTATQIFFERCAGCHGVLR
ncbi:MAG: cytochrome c, partial [Halioglobus sp.]|nr:cytochrome c [Halioglobus sp.]